MLQHLSRRAYGTAAATASRTAPRPKYVVYGGIVAACMILGHVISVEWFKNAREVWLKPKEDASESLKNKKVGHSLDQYMKK
jgi:hypothetical protein